ncbi:hypothetical protein [Legionella spiritensis]|uniref:Transmembrane protein n=1 Tax=Legionella spiritensis TaxID=452 RepID=A0A0W0ZBB7_LEGSP|nr:hypothetical protein [Legionella spiritensis]KTD66351.1 hypothetical protein Lspi_0114 [Legionella spiritensis]SNV48753.1 Uncharacterised protein [Legionella spiritensis]
MFLYDDRNILLFKKIIVIFWCLWWFIALWTDVVGALAHAGFLVKSWAPDTNYPFLVDSLKMYSAPAWVPVVCITGIILWSLFSALAFLWACMGIKQSAPNRMRRIDAAFIISLSFWLAFFLADQLVVKFDLEENHMVQGGFELLTYLALYILPNHDGEIGRVS